MGALVTKALRPIKSFNIENRAHRIISKEKPTPAPMYSGNVEDLKRTLEQNPDIDEKLSKKDQELDLRLRDVYVTSFGRPEDDITREKQEQNKKRPLPKDRKMPENFDFGFKEPERIPYGRTTLRHALNFISAHQLNPEEVTAAKIAVEYKMKESDVADILKYFKTYEIYIPKTRTADATFAGPATMRKQLIKNDTKEIEDKKSAVNLEEAQNQMKSLT